MKIIEAINRIDSLKHNTYTNVDKIEWLSRLDEMVLRLIIDTHEGGEDVVFESYDTKTDLNTEMLVPAPFDEVYLHWLEMQIDYAQAEYGRYNNSSEMFNTAFNKYRNYYNRTHKPKGGKINFF